MLELLKEVRNAIEYTICIEGGEELDRVYDKVCQAIENLKSISGEVLSCECPVCGGDIPVKREPIGDKIENVEVIE